jgi:hypothetical protein
VVSLDDKAVHMYHKYSIQASDLMR